MGYNQSNNPFSRKASPLNQSETPKKKKKAECPPGWIRNKNGDCAPPKKGKPEPQAEPDPRPSRRSSSPLNQVEEQVYEHELGHDEIYEDTRSGENYLEQESYEKPGYDEYGGKIRGKKGRKTRKLERIKQDMKDIGHRIMFEKTPDTISQKADRKFDKYLKTKKQLKNL